MHWLNEHDLILVREVLLFEPWRYRQGSVERGNVWKTVSENLNGMEQPKFKVNERSIRDRLKLLMNKFKKNDNAERNASGIEVGEESELDKGLRDITELFEDSERIAKVESGAKKQKLELDASQAEELRLSSLETYGQTKARKSDGGSSEESKKRRSSNDTIGFLREKSAQDNEFRQQELEIKKQEMQNFLIANQQQQTQQLMQQQQQMNAVFLNILGRFLPNPQNDQM